jgi:hypothetical protein
MDRKIDSGLSKEVKRVPFKDLSLQKANLLRSLAPEVGIPSVDELVLLHAAQDKFPFRRRTSSPTRGGSPAGF